MTTPAQQFQPGLRAVEAETAADPARLDSLTPADLDERGARIPWGDAGHQSVSPVISAGMLRLLRQRDPRLWAELHYEAATGERIDLATTTTRRRGRPGESDT